MGSDSTPVKTGPKRLGELLVESGILSDADLVKGLDYGKKSGMAIGKVLSMLRLVSEPDLRAALHVQSLMKFECLPPNVATRALRHMKEHNCHIDYALKQVGWHSDKFKNGAPPRLQELKEQLSDTEQRLGPDHTDTAQLLLQLCQFYEDEEMWAHAEGHCQLAIHKLEKALGANHLKVADALATMARLLFMQDRFQEAQIFYQQTFDIKYQILGSDNLDVAKALHDLAEVNEVQNKFADAERLYVQSIAVREKYVDVDEPEMLDAIRRLAFVCSRRGRAPDQVMVGRLLTESGILAEEQLPEALEYGKRQNIPLIRALIDLGYLNEESLRPVMHAQVLIKSNLLPAPLAIRILRLCTKRQVSIEEAMALCGWTIKEHPTHNVSELLAAHDELIIAEQRTPSDSEEVATLCLKLGDLYQTYDRFAEAEPLYKRALSLLEHENDNNPKLSEALERIGLISFKQGKFDQAESIYRRVLQMTLDQYGEEHSQVSSIYLHLGQMFVQKGEPHEAIVHLQKALPAAEKHYGAEHTHVGEIVEQLAFAYFDAGDYSRAEPLLWQAYKVKKQYLDPKGQEITALLTKLADLYNKQGQYTMADSVLAMFTDQTSIHL